MEGIDGMSYFSDDEKFEGIVVKKPKDIKKVLKISKYIVSGNFYGIQKFIFENLSTKNASKVLRSKSAFVEIFTYYLARYICSSLKVDSENILATNAGKFEILVEDIERSQLDKIQEQIDNYFIDIFFGLSGVAIFYESIEESNFSPAKNYRKLRERISKKEELNKFSKFKLLNQPPILENYNSNLTNQTLCKVCNFREKSKDERCRVCDSFVRLGEYLVREESSYLSSKLGIDTSYFNDFDIEIKLTDKLKSYVQKDGKEEKEIATFENLAKSSCSNEKDGIKSLAILKADVDNMGKFLKDETNSVTKSFENFDRFSKTIDNFFSIYIPQKLMKDKFKNTYTVFAGGDDLFLLGAWDEILALAREIERDFKLFMKNKNELTISFGIAIAKPSTPISYLAEHTEKLLEKAKEIDEHKDAITLFGETVKWDSYRETFNHLEEKFNAIAEQDISMAFLYRLLDLCNMAKRIKNKSDDFKIEDTMWKSKLNYSFSRNMDKRYTDILKNLNYEIEKHPEETKMFLSEFIYKRRKA